MKKRTTYVVRLSGLGEGHHTFHFELNDAFFATIDESFIDRGEVLADVVLEKKTGLMTLHFNLKGKVEVICDRCLEPFLNEIESTQSVFVKPGEEAGEIEDDVIMIHKDDHEIEVGHLLYEFIVLALPYRKIHPENEDGVPACDPEMIRKLNDHTGGNEEEKITDPRWDALKGIRNNKD